MTSFVIEGQYVVEELNMFLEIILVDIGFRILDLDLIITLPYSVLIIILTGTKKCESLRKS